MTITPELRALDTAVIIKGRTIAEWLVVAEYHRPKTPVTVAMLSEIIEYYPAPVDYETEVKRLWHQGRRICDELDKQFARHGIN